MNRNELMLIAGVALALVSVAAALHAESRNTSRRTIEKSFPAKPGSRVAIDGINGTIKAKGYAGNEVRVVVHEEMHGGRESDLQQAQAEIVLEIDADEHEISFYVDTPWRERNGRWSGWKDRNYEFSHDFELQVPYGVALYLHTVNGDIRVDDVRSVVEFHNVNGAIEAFGIRGIGDVTTVNGEIVLEFREVPLEGGKVETINGDVELTFPSKPDVHLRMKTFNGKLFSDFPYTHRDVVPQVESTRSGGMYVYRSRNSTEIRIGKGGPEWSLKTLNGNIYIRKDPRSS